MDDAPESQPEEARDPASDAPNAEGPRAESLDEEEISASAELLKGPPNRARTGRRAYSLAAAAIRWSEGVHRPFVMTLNAFQESITALRDLHDIISPHVAGLDQQLIDDNIGASVGNFTLVQRRALAEFMREAGPAVASGSFSIVQEDETSTADSGTRADDRFETWGPLKEALGPEKLDAAFDVVTQVYLASVGPRRGMLLRGALLTAAIAALEVLLASLIRQFYLLNPGALGDDPKFSLKDLQDFGTIDDARDEAVARKVDSVIQGDLDDWARWLKTYPELKLESYCTEYPRLWELFQRRHLIVHNGGRVSRRYLNKMADFQKHLPELGEELPVDQEYLDRSLDEVEALGNLVAAGVWTKSRPDEEQVAVHELYLRTYDLMIEGRWQPVQTICAMAQRRAQREGLKWVLQVNHWLARKREGLPYAEEVEAWDTSALGARFRLAQAALLDDHQSALNHVEGLLRAEDLEWSDVLEWPLFEEMRHSEGFEDLAVAFAPAANEANGKLEAAQKESGADAQGEKEGDEP